MYYIRKSRESFKSIWIFNRLFSLIYSLDKLDVENPELKKIIASLKSI